MLQRGKRAEGPEGSPKPQKGSGMGVQSCPRGHSSLQTRNLSLAGVSSHKHGRLGSSQPRAAEPLPPWPHVPHHVPPCPHADRAAPAQRKARENQTSPPLAKPSGAPSPPEAWPHAPVPVGFGGMDGAELGEMGSEARAVMQWGEMGGWSG